MAGPNMNAVMNGKGIGVAIGEKQVKERQERIRQLRREASRKAAVANKRIERIERNELRDSPAYQRYIRDGGQRFGVKGKSYNEVQAEIARLNRFLDAETSTIRGINKNLKEMAANTGIKYRNLGELRAISSKFFELTSKVEQYLRNIEDAASAIGYQRIWQAINEYTKEQKIGLADGEAKIDAMIETISERLMEQNKKLPGPPSIRWYTL